MAKSSLRGTSSRPRWSAKTSAATTNAPTIHGQRRLKAKGGDWPYACISLKRLEPMDSHLKVNGALDANFKLIPNLPRDFRSIQGRAKALLERQGNRVEWPRRSIKHLRSTYASRISAHVSPFQLNDHRMPYVAANGDLGRKIQAAFGKAKAVRA